MKCVCTSHVSFKSLLAMFRVMLYIYHESLSSENIQLQIHVCIHSGCCRMGCRSGSRCRRQYRIEDITATQEHTGKFKTDYPETVWEGNISSCDEGSELQEHLHDTIRGRTIPSLTGSLSGFLMMVTIKLQVDLKVWRVSGGDDNITQATILAGVKRVRKRVMHTSHKCRSFEH